MTALRFTPPLFETRSEPSGRIEGMASTFGGPVDSYGDVIQRGAFADSLTEHKGRGSVPAMLWAHQSEAPVGRWLELKETSTGLEVAGQINMRTVAGRDAYESLSAGDVSGLSIGFRVPEDGASYSGDNRILKKVGLAEISLVAVPANHAARITAVKFDRSKPSTIREFEVELRSMGFSRSEAASIATRGFNSDSLSNHSDDDLQEVQRRLQAFAAEIKQGSHHGR